MSTPSEKMKSLINGFTHQKLNNATGTAIVPDTTIDAILAGGSNHGGAMVKALSAFEAAAKKAAEMQISKPAKLNHQALSVKERMKQFNG